MADNILWAPWRVTFVKGKKETGCVFCKRLKMTDSPENLIVHRGRYCIVILNKYPYNSGHSMIVPKRHVGDIEKLTSKEAQEFFALTQQTVKITKKALKPHSMNLGMNLGRASGAGIPGHLHMHVVPRWIGDTNFMPVFGQTKVISVPLEPMYHALKKGFKKK